MLARAEACWIIAFICEDVIRLGHPFFWLRKQIHIKHLFVYQKDLIDLYLQQHKLKLRWQMFFLLKISILSSRSIHRPSRLRRINVLCTILTYML